MAGRVRSGADLVSVFFVGMVAGLGFAAVDLLRGQRRSPFANGGTAAASKSWVAASWAAVQAFGNDKAPTAAAAVTFFVLLALFPAISAFVSLYGLFASVTDVQHQLATLRAVLPEGAISVVNDELAHLAAAGHGVLSLAFFVSLGISIWSANAGFKALMEGLNVAYETQEARGFIRLNLESLAFTIGAILLALALVAANVYGPAEAARLAPAAVVPLRWLRIGVALAAIILASSVIYRLAPSRPLARWRWITPGGVAASVGWVAMSAAFTWYVASFGSYNRTYGSLGAIVGFLTWVWLSLMVLMLGAELNNELEKRALI